MPIKQTLTPIASSRTLTQVGLSALLVGAYSLLPIWKEFSAYSRIGDTPAELHAALSLILGLLLVFRTNAAYARWWEARILWGSLVNTCRNISIKSCNMVDTSDADFEVLHHSIQQFPSALMNHLRQLTGAAPNGSTTQHQPLRLADELYRWLSRQRSEGRVQGDELRAIDSELAKLMDICGACERIARTPMIRSYKIFARQCVGLFLLTLPWGIVHDFGWWTIPMTIIIAYFMIGLEIVAEHVEEPFGLDEDDLDLESICKNIERTVGEVFASRLSTNRK